MVPRANSFSSSRSAQPGASEMVVGNLPRVHNPRACDINSHGSDTARKGDELSWAWGYSSVQWTHGAFLSYFCTRRYLMAFNCSLISRLFSSVQTQKRG